jgi:hypothetical protein
MIGDDTEARGATDRLALALEEAGFDVGQEFPTLYDAIGRQGAAVVRIGDVRPAVADRLSTALMDGVERQTSQAEEGDNRQ